MPTGEGSNSEEAAAAVEARRSHLTQNPEQLHAHCALACDYIRAGSAPYARQMADEMIQALPYHPDAHYYRGVLLSYLGAMPDASAALQRALSLNPRHEGARSWLQQYFPSVPVPAPVGAPQYYVPVAARVEAPQYYGPAVPKHSPPPRTGYWERVRFGGANRLLVTLGGAALMMGIASFNQFRGSEEESDLARRFPAPVRLTITQFAAASPKSGWFHIKGGVMDVTDASYTLVTPRSGGEPYIGAAFLSLREPRQSPEAPAPVVVATQDPAIMNRVRAIAAFSEAGDDAGLKKYVQANAATLITGRDVEGLLTTGGYDAKDRDDIAKKHGIPGESLVILDEGRAPDAGQGVTQLFLAMVSALFSVAFAGAFGLILWLGIRPRG
jgi:tetratricopeptide (TPR) repeat protein